MNRHYHQLMTFYGFEAFALAKQHGVTVSKLIDTLKICKGCQKVFVYLEGNR